MYHHIRGRLLETGPMLAVVETGGVGFEVRVPLSTLEAIKGREEVLLYTRLWVREDDLRIFGFATRAEREIFQLVLGVSGVGPSIALAALSTLAVDQLVVALASGDTSRIQRIKGVGKRLAERLVVELKDRVARLDLAGVEGGEGLRPPMADEPLGDPRARDAVAALIELGFPRKSAEERVASQLERLLDPTGDEGAGLSVERLIREALR